MYVYNIRIPQKQKVNSSKFPSNIITVLLSSRTSFTPISIVLLFSQSALRILDCYLLEGHKILFRVSLAILKINEQHILDISEQVSMLVFLKEITRHTFHIDELLDVCHLMYSEDT